MNTKKERLKSIISKMDFQDLIDLGTIKDMYQKTFKEQISASLIIKMIGRTKDRAMLSTMAVSLKNDLKKLIRQAGSVKKAQQLLNYVN